MKKISVSLVTVILIISFALSAFAVNYPKPTSEFFVNDFADCITSQDEKTMRELAEKLYKDTKAQVVCVTVDSLEGMSVREYAIELAREWEIGEKDKNTGVLLLLSKSDRKVDIEVGYGLEGALPDGKTGRILDEYAMPFLKKDDFSTGLKEAFTVLINETYTELGVNVEGYEPVDEQKKENLGSMGMFAVLLIAAVIVVLIRASRHSGGNGGNGGNGSDDFGDRGHTSIWPWIFLGNAMGNNRHHGNNPFDDDDDNFGGFGGFGGGGFGGGGFGGGGGSFGGGGSSRGF